MGLTELVGEVRRDGDKRAQALMASAKRDADAVIAEAKREAADHKKARAEQASRDAEMLLQQAKSRADSEGRKVVLQTESELRAELRAMTLQAFAELSDKARKAHLEKLLARAAKIVPAGSVWGAKADEAALKAQKTYTYAGTTDIAGGIIVESKDGDVRLDLSYGTLLAEMWRDVLKAEAKLFQG